MKKQNVQSLAAEVYGAGAALHSQEIAPNLVQVGVIHPQGIPLVVLLAPSEELGLKAVESALVVLKAGG